MLRIFAAARAFNRLRHGMNSVRDAISLTAHAFAYKDFHSVARVLRAALPYAQHDVVAPMHDFTMSSRGSPLARD